MKTWVKVALSVAAATVLATISAGALIQSANRREGVVNRAWETNMGMGHSDAGMYTRAAIAIGGLFALNKKETLYFTAFQDDGGEPLHARCDYILEGGDIASRWWSMTVYGSDHFLIANPENRYSYNMANLERGKDNRYELHLSATKKPGNWIPTGESGDFSITLRAYNPEASIYDHPATTPLPSIKRVGCP
jgi:hypothetical protein